MAEILFTEIIDEDRKGWSLPCPACNEEVPYTILHVRGGSEPFLYCDTCSNFVLRREDAERLSALSGDAAGTIDQLRDLYQELEQRLPPCPCGGHFNVWANVKCPKCRYEFPYNQGVRSEEVRFNDSTIVWIESATAFRGATEPSNRLRHVEVT